MASITAASAAGDDDGEGGGGTLQSAHDTATWTTGTHTIALRIGTDILDEPTDAIVNTTNRMLQHVNGLSWRLVERGGQSIQAESTMWLQKYGAVNRHGHRALPVTEVLPTSAGDLHFRRILHTVPPTWNSDPQGSSADVDALKATVQNLLDTVPHCLDIPPTPP